MLDLLILTSLPALGTLAGGLLALRFTLTSQQLSYVLHVGAGVVLGVVGVELMPRVLAADARWVVLAAFFAGALLYVLVTAAADVLAERAVGGAGKGSAWGIVIGVGLDLVTDGMMIAAGDAIGGGLALLLGVGLLVADFPEAFSAVAAVREDLGKRVSLYLTFAFAVAVLAGAPLGYLLLADASELFELSIASATAGMLMLVVIEGLVPEAHELSRREAGRAGLLFVAGFVLFAGLSHVIG